MSAPPKYTCPLKTTSSSTKVPLTGYPETSSDDDTPIAAKMSTALVVQAVVPSVVAPRDKKKSDDKYVLACEDPKYDATRMQIMALWKEQGPKLTQISGIHEACQAIDSAIVKMKVVHCQLVPEFLRGVAGRRIQGTTRQSKISKNIVCNFMWCLSERCALKRRVPAIVLFLFSCARIS